MSDGWLSLHPDEMADIRRDLLPQPDYERLLYLVAMAHREYHKRPDCPRRTCEICREMDRLKDGR